MGTPHNLLYYGCYEELIGVVVLGRWVPNVVIYQVYANEVVRKDDSILFVGSRG